MCFGRHVKPLVPAAFAVVMSVGYGPFFLCVMYKKGLCPSSRDINKLMMMMIKTKNSCLLERGKPAER
jgi:hypothetical protein